eukprot:1141214-Pelagomonas_calceolata.AAC.4
MRSTRAMGTPSSTSPSRLSFAAKGPGGRDSTEGAEAAKYTTSSCCTPKACARVAARMAGLAFGAWAPDALTLEEGEVPPAGPLLPVRLAAQFRTLPAFAAATAAAAAGAGGAVTNVGGAAPAAAFTNATLLKGSARTAHEEQVRIL